MTQYHSALEVVDKIGRANFVIQGLSLVLAADLVSLWSGHSSIIQQSWTGVLHTLTPLFVLKVVLLMALGQWFLLPLLQWVLGVFLLPWIPDFLVPFHEHCRECWSIERLEQIALAENNQIAWERAQRARMEARQSWELAQHLGLFFVFVGLDWIHSGSVIGQFANYGWRVLHVGLVIALAAFFYLRIVLEAMRNDIGETVFVGDAAQKFSPHQRASSNI